MKLVTFNNGTSNETILGNLVSLGDVQRYVLTRADNGQEIDLHKSDIILIEDNAAVTIGTIVYKQYEENVLLDANFSYSDLVNIINNDPDFTEFKIPTLDYSFKKSDLVRVYKHEEILGTTYNAFAKNPFTYKTKVTWYASYLGHDYGIQCKTKREATTVVDKTNTKAFDKLQAICLYQQLKK